MIDNLQHLRGQRRLAESCRHEQFDPDQFCHFCGSSKEDIYNGEATTAKAEANDQRRLAAADANSVSVAINPTKDYTADDFAGFSEIGRKMAEERERRVMAAVFGPSPLAEPMRFLEANRELDWQLLNAFGVPTHILEGYDESRWAMSRIFLETPFRPIEPRTVLINHCEYDHAGEYFRRFYRLIRGAVAFDRIAMVEVPSGENETTQVWNPRVKADKYPVDLVPINELGGNCLGHAIVLPDAEGQIPAVLIAYPEGDGERAVRSSGEGV